MDLMQKLSPFISRINKYKDVNLNESKLHRSLRYLKHPMHLVLLTEEFHSLILPCAYFQICSTWNYDNLYEGI